MNNGRDNIFREYSEEESAFAQGALSSKKNTDGAVLFRMKLTAKEYILCDFSMYAEPGEGDFDPTEQFMQERDPDQMTGEEFLARTFAESEKSPASEEYSMTAEAYLTESDEGKCILSYKESLDGESEQITEIHFHKDSPNLVTICKAGMATTVMTIEQGVRHSCVYRTPFMDFEMRIHALRVVNTVTEKGGRLKFDYALEIRGAEAHRTVMEIELSECTDG